MPWGDFTYVGTTDTDYDGPVDDPQCTPSDVDYLLRAMNGVLTEPVTEDDVVGTWAGLRPLLRTASSARTADLSRRHGVRVSESGVVTITGGKLTTYRRMASDTVDEVQRRLGTERTRCRTKQLPLLGGEGFTPGAPGNEPSLHEHLAGRYGTEALAVLALVGGDPSLGEPLVPGLPYVRAEAVYAARHEMARSVDDVLSRRTRARLLARDASGAAAPEVARLLAPELGWDDARDRAPGGVLPEPRRGRAGRVAHGGPGSRLTGPMRSSRARCLRSRKAGRRRRSRSAPTRPTSSPGCTPGSSTWTTRR